MFDSTATQTPKIEMISIGTDKPSFSDINLLNAKDDIKLCSKCKNELNPDLQINVQKSTEEKSLEDLFKNVNFIRVYNTILNTEKKVPPSSFSC